MWLCIYDTKYLNMVVEWRFETAASFLSVPHFSCCFLFSLENGVDCEFSTLEKMALSTKSDDVSEAPSVIPKYFHQMIDNMASLACTNDKASNF